MKHAVSLVTCLVLTGLLALPSGLAAQVLYGSIVVDVRDQSGGAVPGADVTITNADTGWTRTTTSNDVGTVTFTTVPPGTYDVRVSLSGFREFRTTGVRVSENNVLRVNSLLEVGQLTDAVTVSAGVAVLQTDRADVRTEIPATQLENLPVPVGRNYQNLFVTVPGISPPENMHSVAVNPARGLAFSSNGTTRNANAIRIEGAISNNLWLPHVAAYVPALEAIESVGVTTSTFDADQGLSGGMSANVLIKSGTNQFHGSAFEYFFNESMKSRPYFLPSTEKKPDTSQNQFGGTLGGPLVRNKLFFFGSYQGTFDTQLAQRFGTVPTQAMRNGDFSASPNPIYDPATGNANGTGRTAFPGNVIPRARIDSIALKLIETLPLPNQPGITNNYYATGDYTFTRHNIDAKMNYNPTNRLGITARLGWLGYNFKNPAMFGELGGLPINSTAAKAGTGLGDTYTITGSASYVFSPTFLIDTYAGVTTIEVLVRARSPRREARPAISSAFPAPTATIACTAGGRTSPLRTTPRSATPAARTRPTSTTTGRCSTPPTATWTRGSHTVRFGGDIVRQAMNRAEPGNGSGSFSFAGGPTALSGGPSVNQYNTFAAFLLGLPTGVSKGVIPYENGYTRSRNWQFSFFVKDQWQVTRKLTASLGLRYDYFPMGTRTTRGMERYDLTTNTMLICGVGSVPTDCGYEMGPGNISPRLGLAYRLNETIVLRGGYGINYDPYPLAFVRNLIGNYPSRSISAVPQAERVSGCGDASGRHSGDSRAGCDERHHPGAEWRQRAGAAAGAEARLHTLVERHRAVRVAGRVHWSGRIRGDPAARHQSNHGCQRRPGYWRRQCRAAALPAVRADRCDRYPQQSGLEQLRFAAVVADAAHGERRPAERGVYVVEGIRHLLRHAQRQPAAGAGARVFRPERSAPSAGSAAQLPDLVRGRTAVRRGQAAT